MQVIEKARHFMHRDFSIFNCLVQFSFASASVFALAFHLAMPYQFHIAFGLRRRCRDVEKHTCHLA
ncbi:hypothetical protein ABH944_000823 [Caballeronia udeis]|jgi:hypothetical protein|uniref:Uncharacterized protein n=1 Tax=Caballeronia udeis TaxID=1232866 RepID=A0ABW8MAW1_9BURK